jgi:[ribosomal protein S5]-alanine N-acetyltransferase
MRAREKKPTPNGLGTRILTERLLLRPPAEDHGPSVARAIARNAEHLARVSPTTRPSSSLVDVARRVAVDRSDFRKGTGFVFYGFARASASRKDELVPEVLAKVALNGVQRGAMESAYLGYWVDRDHEGKGLAYEAVRAVMRFAFEEAKLHRLQAAIQPWNARSITLAERLGFRHEGIARRYLNVGGGWQDHSIFAFTSEDWTFGPQGA